MAVDPTYQPKIYFTDGGDRLKVASGGTIEIESGGAITGASSIISQALNIASFTDNANTTGYIDITTQIPANSVVLGWKAVVATGFTGDTTATVQVGISGTLDKYSVVTTNSVLAAATVGATVKAGNSYEAAAVTARVTVTGTADFTSISAGSMVVTIYYLALA